MNDLIFIILLPILAAALCFLIPLKISRYISCGVQVVLTIYTIGLFKTVKDTGPIVQNIGGWQNYVGITLRADEFACVMVILTAVLFLAVGIYQLGDSYPDNLFLFLILVLEGLITGIFLSNDLFNIFVLVEVATIVISILIMFKKDSQSIYDGILYLMINVVSMSFFLMGLGMLYKMSGVIDLNGISLILEQLDDVKPFILPYSFIITSVCLKAALLPLFDWLPKAHGTPGAPACVSALLSGLYVKTGVYLFIRIQHVFLPYFDTSTLFYILGFLTAAAGFILALSQTDIKLILAYHTVSQIGLIMMGVNMGNPYARIGALYHIVNHAVFKTALFLTAEMIIDRYKTRDVYLIKGVLKKMPLTAAAVIFSVLGITGAPYFNGSISKYWIAYGAKDSWAEYGIIIVNLGTVISFVKYSGMLWGKDKDSAKFSDGNFRNSVVIILAVACFAGGIFGNQAIYFLFGQQITVDTYSYMMKILTYMLTLLVGWILYRYWIKKSRIPDFIRGIKISFNNICVLITCFFFFIFIYLQMV